MAAENASLRIRGEDHDLGSPRLVSLDEAIKALVDEPPADFTKAEDFVLMDQRD